MILQSIPLTDTQKYEFGPAGYMLYVLKEEEAVTLRLLEDQDFVKYYPRSQYTHFDSTKHKIIRSDYSAQEFKEGDEIVLIWRVSKIELEEYNKLKEKLNIEKNDGIIQDQN